MLKIASQVKTLEQRAAEHLRILLSVVPAIEIKGIDEQARSNQRAIDLVAHVRVAGRSHSIVCEVKDNGQPRYVRMALLQLQSYISHFDSPATPLNSPRSRA
jgi:hypothetical protein